MVRDVSSCDAAERGFVNSKMELPLLSLFSVVEEGEEEEGEEGEWRGEGFAVTAVDEATKEDSPETGGAHSSSISLFRPVSTVRISGSSSVLAPVSEPGPVVEATKEGGAAMEQPQSSSMSSVIELESLPKDNETVARSGDEESSRKEGEEGNEPFADEPPSASKERYVSMVGTDPSGGLDEACGDVHSAIKGVVWLVVWSSSIFMAVFLYDVTADSAGPDAARTTVSVVIVAPLIVYILYHICLNVAALFFRHCGVYLAISSDVGASCYGRASTSLGYMKDSLQACYHSTKDRVKSSFGIVVVHRNEHFMHNPDTEMANVGVTVL
jgi:hypothetical protein